MRDGIGHACDSFSLNQLLIFWKIRFSTTKRERESEFWRGQETVTGEKGWRKFFLLGRRLKSPQDDHWRMLRRFMMDCQSFKGTVLAVDRHGNMIQLNPKPMHHCLCFVRFNRLAICSNIFLYGAVLLIHTSLFVSDKRDDLGQSNRSIISLSKWPSSLKKLILIWTWLNWLRSTARLPEFLIGWNKP